STQGDQKSFQTASGFRCDGRVYCSQMTSRAEAEFFVRNCPNTRMDGDGDGIPCENDSRF
ncbi:MAG: excalibur calcium-binding domain-containing protein, partial [Burkholderiales bacterium]|nr:excalibur calcium-binding domain-containing protein [Burkholderiales bacterium]